MAQYFENRIVLSAEESRIFGQKMNNPNLEAAQRRDRNLNWIARHMEFEATASGFSVTIDDGIEEDLCVVCATAPYCLIPQKEQMPSADIEPGAAAIRSLRCPTIKRWSNSTAQDVNADIDVLYSDTGMRPVNLSEVNNAA